METIQRINIFSGLLIRSRNINLNDSHIICQSSFNKIYCIIFLNIFIYLWLCWVFVAVRGLLIVVASLVVEHGLQVRGLQQLWFVECRLSTYGAQAQLLHGMWDLPGPGLEPVSPALAGGFLITAPPAKSLLHYYLKES